MGGEGREGGRWEGRGGREGRGGEGGREGREGGRWGGRVAEKVEKAPELDRDSFHNQFELEVLTGIYLLTSVVVG